MIRTALAALLFVISPAVAETVDGRESVIIDGNTVAFRSERVRIMNIDAPETRSAHCERELVAGLKAKERLAMLLRSGSVEIERDGEDIYGRTLALLDVNGLDVGQIMIHEGLALPWQKGKDAREDQIWHWCGEKG